MNNYYFIKKVKEIFTRGDPTTKTYLLYNINELYKTAGGKEEKKEKKGVVIQCNFQKKTIISTYEVLTDTMLGDK